MSQLEHQLQRLQEIVQLLNNSKIPLDELLRLYEEGMILAGQCRQDLAHAEQKITIIQQNLVTPNENSY